jgi:pimeloyl-ACP methyl ester carboxylesterase
MPLSDHYQLTGSGSPIVFVHGSYATTSTWKKMIEQLSARHTCIAIKLPGHCGTPDPQDFDAPTIETELKLIEDVVRSLTDEPIHLVGHSYGGVVALSQALKGSLPIHELTLFEPVATWVLDTMGDADMQAQVDAFLQRYRQDAANQVPYACGQVIDFWGGGNEFEALPTFVKDMMAPLTANNLRHWDLCTQIRHTRDELAQLEIPTRIVCGTRSNEVAHAIANHLDSELPISSRYDIEDASHAMVNSHPDDCLFILQDPVEVY